MKLFFYNLALLAALVLGAPWWLWGMATRQKYREGLLQRLGRVRLKPDNSARPLIWLHAVSVGEVLAVSRLVQSLDASLDQYSLVISTTTRTGMALARERFGASRVFYCPLDLPWAVRAYLSTLKPRLLILAETEFWPNLLTGCFRRGIPVAVVNARVSDRSLPRYKKLRWFWQPILARLTRVLAQSETDAERLKSIGCDAAAVSVAGNLKFDVRSAVQADATRLLKKAAGTLRFLVAGSTLDGEEISLLQAWPQILQSAPDTVMVLAPRHPDRFAFVEDLLKNSPYPSVRRSAWTPGIAQPTLTPGQIVLLDTIGELASVYSVASVAFVGGSVVPAGGHNPLEPAQFGVPIVMGPHFVNFRSITEDLLAHDALRIAPKTELADAIIHLLSDRSPAEAMGARARRVFEQQSGATQHCLEALTELLHVSPIQPAQPAMEPLP